ncbi:nuclease-related domain-containing protein [Salinicoccus albus]|uniref:nuclease-related domain-containing protein n=1 Tax=Salinicoccus albus TaxID=418756 RepID=UPI000378AAC5|nr:nuclease-related domain-containing protein [Salinicoccus albus]
MFLNERKEPLELLYYRVLRHRRQLSDKEARSLSIYEKGFSGECLYDEVFEETGHDNVFIFRDIWLQVEAGNVQLDSLIVSDGEMEINEIKNYSGEYVYHDGVWKIQNRRISEDPISQLRRAVNKLIKVKFEKNLSFDVKGKIVFPNPYFVLESAERSSLEMIVKREKLKKYMRSFRMKQSGRSAEMLVKEIAERMVENPYFKPKTDFTRLRQGYYCVHCGSFEVEKRRVHVICKKCFCREVSETAIVRMAVEFKLLFPERKLTVNEIYAFSGGLFHKDHIQRHLSKHGTRSGQGPTSFYEVHSLYLKDFSIENRYKSSNKHRIR